MWFSVLQQQATLTAMLLCVTGASTPQRKATVSDFVCITLAVCTFTTTELLQGQ